MTLWVGEDVGQECKVTLKNKLEDKSAHTVSTQLDLKEFFDKEYQLPKQTVQPITTRFQSVSFISEEDTIHLVNKNGLHYATVIKRPDTPEFEEMYQQFRHLQADLPVSCWCTSRSLYMETPSPTISWSMVRTQPARRDPTSTPSLSRTTTP
ncbi:related to magnesium-dependent acid phosphatase [Sporisorium scitamineum]|uniref:Related to magnesium-dependent acid phosphatase n=1 Tax=Sporisorium scitamineum TaxID=49012 RepID=A0A0F7SAD6_9BASI|nr:related to magnesium-dependent acid phosphatase [Sporisorium scitamineum]CDW98424.1 hypothetical protein [Sporisorium scitamineum]